MVTGEVSWGEHELSKSEFQMASSDCRVLNRAGQRGPMRLRRLLFSRNDPYAHVANRKGVTKKRGTASARSRYPVCFATIFGATLKTILDFSGVCTDKKTETTSALHEMLQFLGPVGECIGTTGGIDQPHLVNGLATQRVSRKQSKYMPECTTEVGKSSWFGRSGLKDVTMGVTAAVLVAHYVMAATGSDAGEVTTNLSKCVDNARSLLQTWDVSRIPGLSMHRAALQAETRALERARAASFAAEKVAASAGLDRLSGLHLQLSYMRSAAWPSLVSCDGENHAWVVRNLSNGDSIDGTLEDEPHGMPSYPVLHLLRGVQHNGIADQSSGSEASSIGSSSAASSIASDDGVLDRRHVAVDPFMEREIAVAVERMRSVGTTA